MPAFLRQEDAQLVAVCDVNTGSHGYKTPEQFLGRKPGQDRVNAYYAKKTGVGQYKGCDAYNDFREVLLRAGRVRGPGGGVACTRRPVQRRHEGEVSRALCQRRRTPLRSDGPWHPKLEQILGDEEASQMLSRPIRAPWTI